MRRVTKADYQDFLRSVPWQIHVVLDEQALKTMSDRAALELVQRLSFDLCKTNLHRKFSKFPLSDRCHWMGVFQGTRDARSRHLHVMIYIPPSLWRDSCLRKLRIKSAVQSSWLRVRCGIARTPDFVWQRVISGAADSTSVATYVSRLITPDDWDIGSVYFSQ